MTETGSPQYLHSAAVAAWRAGDHRAAEAYYRAAIIAVEKTADDAGMDIVSIAVGLIDLYRNQGRCQEAETLCQHILELRNPSVGLSARGRIVVRLAELHRQQGRLEDAEDAYVTALVERIVSYGVDHPKVAQVAIRLSEIYRDLGQCDKAARMLQQAIPVAGGDNAPATYA